MKPMRWVLLGLIVLVAFGMSMADNTYIGAAKCKMCHKVQFTSWEASGHAKGFDRLTGDETSNPDCLKCHATNASEEMAGVQCEACHGAGNDFKKMSIMKDLDAAIANGLVIPTQATCDGCHTGDDHATKKVMADELNNKEAIHEFKNPPGE